MAQRKEQIKTLEKEHSEEEIANLPVAEFKTLVIRMLTEMIEFSHKMKAIQSKSKNIYTRNQQ